MTSGATAFAETRTGRPEIAAAGTRDCEAQRFVQEIEKRRRRTVRPLFCFSFLLFCGTLVAFAYLPSLVAYRVYGVINVAYCLALAQFGVTFLVAAAYGYWAKSAIDPLTLAARTQLTRGAGEKLQ
jgi:uncharacterized membrane protein (DUF485 family)